MDYWQLLNFVIRNEITFKSQRKRERLFGGCEKYEDAKIQMKPFIYMAFIASLVKSKVINTFVQK